MRPSRSRGPTFVVAGAGRAGSTAVTEGLRAHPDVFVTQPKEPHFLALGGRPVEFTGPGDDSTINKLAVTELDRYLELFPDGNDFLALGEGSVSTLYYPDSSIPAIESLNADMRIVVVLRDPVERAFSSFQYLSVRGFEPLDDFLDAVADEPRRRELGWHHLWHYTGMSHYADDIARFVHAFGDRVGVWFHDDLENDSAGTIGDIQRFIGVDPARAETGNVRRVNASGQPRVQSVQAAMQWAVRHDSLRSAVKRAVPFRVREWVRSANLQPHGADSRVRDALRPQFAADLERLQGVLGREVPDGWWK
ncbi:MAG TPA: hypothetical protein VMW94_08155 [Actinomycetes bacterium]|nr:hypothetical protein [Actinomycetes bacterium]